MYRQPRPTKTTIVTDPNAAYVGETIEAKIRRIKTTGAPIGDGAPLIYTENSEGVVPEYDIRTDKFEVMIEANEKAYEQHVADKKAFIEKLENDNKKPDQDKGGTTEDAQGTGKQ